MKRHIAAIACLLAVAAVAAGCKSTGPQVASANGTTHQASPTSTASPMPSPAADEADRALQFQQCMHDQGVEVQTGPKGDVGVQASPGNKQQAITATEACRAYLPGGGEKEKLTPEDIERLRQFSQCVRDHGYPDWPDPDPETGEMKFDAAFQSRLGNLKSDPQFRQAVDSCQNLTRANGGAKG